MSRSITALIVLSLALGACGLRDSRVNPFNWFGNSREEATAPQEAQNTNPLIPTENRGLFSFREARDRADIYRGTPVDAIQDLVIERVPGGAIIRASGISRVQDSYDVRLTPVSDDLVPNEGVLEFRLESIVPSRPRRGGPERLRTISAGLPVTDQQLEGVRSIRVAGLQNSRITSRR